MRSLENRSPGSLRAHLPSRRSLPTVLSLLTLGVALTLIVVPGVPAIFSQGVIALASDDSPEQEQELKLIEGWILDLSDDSWAIRSVARQLLIAKGQPARASLAKALVSPDPEVREQAQSIIEQLEQKKKQPQPKPRLDDGKGPVERRVIRLGSDRAIQIEIGPDGQVHIESDRLPQNTDPFEAIRAAEQRMKKMEQELQRQFPDPFAGRSIFGPLDLFDGFGPGRNGWSGSSRFQVIRNGQTVIDTSTSSATMTVEPVGLQLETVHPALRAHLPQIGEEGLLISAVREGSRAESLGLQRWDLLISIGETPVSSFEQMEELLPALTDNSRLKIVRSGETTVLESKKSAEPKPKRF